MSVRNYEFEERDRLRRQKELIKRYGQDVIDKKIRDLCTTCQRSGGCNLIPTPEGCVYYMPVASAIIEPEDIEWEELK